MAKNDIMSVRVNDGVKHLFYRIGSGKTAKGVELVYEYIREIGLRNFMRELKERKIK